jgi:hypothetical protein
MQRLPAIVPSGKYLDAALGCSFGSLPAESVKSDGNKSRILNRTVTSTGAGDGIQSANIHELSTKDTRGRLAVGTPVCDLSPRCGAESCGIGGSLAPWRAMD